MYSRHNYDVICRVCLPTGLFFGSTMLMVSLALLMTVIVTNIYSKKDTFETPPRWLVRRARRWDPKFMKNFPAADQTTIISHSSPVQLRNGRPMTSRPRTPPPELIPPPPHHHHHHLHQHHDSDGDTDSSAAAARDHKRSRMFCCAERRRKRKLAARDMRSAGVNAGRFLYATARYRQEGFACTLQQSFDSERNSTEWQLITKYLDRHLLYLYFVISIGTQLVLIYGMAGSHRDGVPKDIDQ